MKLKIMNDYAKKVFNGSVIYDKKRISYCLKNATGKIIFESQKAEDISAHIDIIKIHLNFLKAGK